MSLIMIGRFLVRAQNRYQVTTNQTHLTDTIELRHQYGISGLESKTCLWHGRKMGVRRKRTVELFKLSLIS